LAKKPDHLADFEADDSGGALGGWLAEENELDSRTLWRIASWGVGATGAVILAVMANQSSLGLKRDQVAAADITRQGQQIQLMARETQNEARRLAAAIDTLNSDRDRLYSRVTSLEHGLDSVTGAVARQGSAPVSPPVAHAEPQAVQNAQLSPTVAPVATAPAAADKPATTAAEPALAVVSSVAKDAAKTDAAKADSAKPEPAKETGKETAKETAKETTKADTIKPEPAKPSPATALVAEPSMMAPPDPAAGKLIEPGKAPNPVIASPIPDVVAAAPSASDAEEDEATAPKVSLQRTEFGVDLGSANSVNGLRALWRGLLKSRSNAPLAPLRPIIVIKEGTNGLGMQLRLGAGPLNDAGAAARICAFLTENKRPCETTIFDGQRLSLKSDEAPPPTAAKPMPHRRALAKRAAVVVEEVPKKPEPPPAATQTTLSSMFGKRSSQ
jgi:hypothetical protein